MAPRFDISTVREQFPALKQDQVFFDNAGGSQTLGGVIDSISSYLTNGHVQLGASYDIGRQSTERYTDGCKAGAEFINAEPDEVVIGSSTTQLLHNLSHTLSLAPDSEIILSALDHAANTTPWLALAARTSSKVIWWTPSPVPATNPILTPASLTPLLTPQTRLVACTHASNVLGTISDIKALAATIRAHAPSALFCVDGVALAPHRRIDVRDLGVDFYVFSWYKVYGPHAAQLFASRRAQEQMRGLGHAFNPSATLEQKMGLAGASYELVSSIPVIVEYLGGRPGTEEAARVEWDIRERERTLQGVLLGWFELWPDVFTVFGEMGAGTVGRVPTVSFTVRDWSSRAVVEAVEARSRIGCRWGHFYSKRLVSEVLGLGDEGVVRVSMVHYNTEEEVYEFMRVLDRVIHGWDDTPSSSETET